MTPRSYCQLLAALTLGVSAVSLAHSQEALPPVQETQAVQIAPTQSPPSPGLSAQPQANPTAPPVTPSLDQIHLPAGSTLGAPAAPPQAPIGPPFQLEESEQQFVDQILREWENQSSQVKTFGCKFERWEYDPVFGPGDETPMIKSKGELTYSKPDKGNFKIEEIYRYVQKDQAQPGEYVLQEHEVGEHWVCDGKAVYEYNHKNKQLVVQPLPPEMRGTSIVDGPLPFLFGAQADKLKSRYWIRTKQSDEATIWLEAYPRTHADAANYHHVEVMLDRKSMMPTAIQVHMPNGVNKAVYMFQDAKVNDKLNQLLDAIFSSPRTPLGWTKVVQDVPAGAQPGPQATNPQALGPH